MKTTYSIATTLALAASSVNGQATLSNGQPTSTAAAGSSGFGGNSCIGNCFSSLYSTEAGSSWQSTLCGNSTALANVNNCISSSSCSSSEKEGTYQVLAQACANMGSTLTASQEATFSATSGGSAYPTNSEYAALASSFATITSAPSGRPTAEPGFVSSLMANHTGWSAGGGEGPFGSNVGTSGWGQWASDSTGSWTDGPWTSWWGASACPPSTWSGWTSGPWGTNAPWTTWTGCTASTTATSVVTTTVAASSGGSSSVVVTTDFGVKVAQATSASGSAASASSSGSAGEKRAVAGAGAGLAGLAAAVLMM